MSTPAACEFWLHGFPDPGRTEPWAEQIEAWGFDGVLLADTQNLAADPFVVLGGLARVTTTLGLGTGVVNPLTRHPAVIASAAATLQLESNGRAVLGVGRGDSSLARVGLRPPTTTQLRNFILAVRAYLRGQTIDLAGHPNAITWIHADRIPTPPVELAATGPRSIAAGATSADRLMLTIGADPGRVGDAIERARVARRQAGLDPDTLRVGAYVNIACHEDADTARDLVRGSAAVFVHFAAMSGGTRTSLSPTDPDESTSDRYGLSTTVQADVLDPGFLDWFTVAGPPAHCAQRLQALVDLGLDRIVLAPCSRDTDPRVVEASNAALATEVLPALRSRGSTVGDLT